MSHVYSTPDLIVPDGYEDLADEDRGGELPRVRDTKERARRVPRAEVLDERLYGEGRRHRHHAPDQGPKVADDQVPAWISVAWTNERSEGPIVIPCERISASCGKI